MELNPILSPTARLVCILAIVVLIPAAILVAGSSALYRIRNGEAAQENKPSYVLEPGWKWAMSIMGALATYSMLFTRFLPSDACYRASLYVTAAIFVFVFALAAKTYRSSADTSTHRWRRNRWFHAFTLALGLGLLSLCALGGYCAEAANFFIGVETDRDVVVTGYFIGIYGCSHPEIGRPVFSSALCYLPYSQDTLTPGTVLRLHGAASWLGIRVERVSIVG